MKRLSSLGLTLLFVVNACASNSSTEQKPKETPPPRTETSTVSAGEAISNWLKINEAKISAFGSAVDLFEAEAKAPNAYDNRGIARASLLLYSALSELPMQPTSLPFSSQFNRAINQMTIVMANVSQYAGAGDEENMLIAALEWQSARNLFNDWYASLPQD
jgi:hypothetical protein